MKAINSTMRMSFCFGVLLICGCENGQLALNDEARNRINAEELAHAEKRHSLFVECMGLAASIKRVGDDDVSDIIDECNSVAIYTSKHYSKSN
jgi:hypothetical protein